MKNSNRLQQWVDKHPDRFSFFIVSIFALAFIAILVCLLIGELYLLFFLVGVGGGLFGYFVLKNADNNYDGYINHDYYSDDVKPPLSTLSDPLYWYLSGNAFNLDDCSTNDWRDYEN